MDAVHKSLFHPRLSASASAPRKVRTDLLPSFAPGDGHEVEALSLVRRADARSAEIDRSAGVLRSFQVSKNSVEPRESSRARNLLTNDNWRVALADEPEPLWPEVAFVGDATAASGLRERLARARAGPERDVVWPSSSARGGTPNGDACEEVGLRDMSYVLCG
jgi:hypothetical protein